MSYLWHGVCPVFCSKQWQSHADPSRHSTLNALTKAGASFLLAFPLQPLSKPDLWFQPKSHLPPSCEAEQPKAGSGWVERNSESYRWSYCKELFNWWACQSFTMDAVYPTGLFSLPPVMIISTRCSSPKWMPEETEEFIDKNKYLNSTFTLIWPGYINTRASKILRSFTCEIEVITSILQGCHKD